MCDSFVKSDEKLYSYNNQNDSYETIKTELRNHKNNDVSFWSSLQRAKMNDTVRFFYGKVSVWIVWIK